MSVKLSVDHSSVTAFQPSDLGFQSGVLLHQIGRFFDAVFHDTDWILKICNLSLPLLVVIPSFSVLAPASVRPSARVTARTAGENLATYHQL